MPTLKDLKATSSKKSLQNINADPAKNSVMGNVKLLYDNLVELQKPAAAKVQEKGLQQDQKNGPEAGGGPHLALNSKA